MKTLVVYDSLYGNTKKIAEVVADTCKRYGEVRLEPAERPNSIELQDEDMVFVGSPTHNQNLSPIMKAQLENTPKQSLRGVKAAAFDTRYELPNWLLWLSAGTAANKLAAKLAKLGAKVIARPESFLIQRDQEGPLKEGELERAKAWAKTVLEKVQAEQPLVQASKVEVA